MEYCPFCSGLLKKAPKVCPHCNKALNLNMYKSIYQPASTTKPNRSAMRKLWFKENARFILPALFLIIGLVAGAVGMFGYSILHFQMKQNGYEQEITELNSRIQNSGSLSKSIQDSLAADIASRDSVLIILSEQNRILQQIISFTRRAANNSTLAANSQTERDYFRRNFRYLERLYENEQEKLEATFYQAVSTYNLQTIPLFLGE